MAAKPLPTVVVQHPGTYNVPVAPASPKTLKVWSPEGKEEEHLIANARDLVRSRKYTYGNPKAAPSALPERVGVGGFIAGFEDSNKQEPNPALDHLNDLRARAAAVLGGHEKIDPNWGLKRLEEEIAKATPAKVEIFEGRVPEGRVPEG